MWLVADQVSYATKQDNIQYVRVLQDTRLDYRVLDLRTPANQGIFRVQCQVAAVSGSVYMHAFFIKFFEGWTRF